MRRPSFRWFHRGYHYHFVLSVPHIFVVPFGHHSCPCTATCLDHHRQFQYTPDVHDQFSHKDSISSWTDAFLLPVYVEVLAFEQNPNLSD